MTKVKDPPSVHEMCPPKEVRQGWPDFTAWLEQMGAEVIGGAWLSPDDRRVDRQAGLELNVRLVTLDRDLVDQYARSMTNGDEFPPVVLRQIDPLEPWIPLCGNHRLAAAQVSGTSLPSIVVTAADDAAFMIAFGDNSRHGKPPTDLERTRVAIRLIETFGMSRPEAARFTNTQATRIATHQRAKAFHDKLIERGGDPRLFEETEKARLWQVSDNEIMWALADVVAEKRPKFEQMSELVTELNRVPDRDIAFDMVEEFRVSLARRHARQRALYGQVLDRCGWIVDFADPDLILDGIPTPDSAKYVADSMERAAEKLLDCVEYLRSS